MRDNGIRNRIRAQGKATTGKCACGDVMVLRNGRCAECNGVKQAKPRYVDYRQFGKLADFYAASDPR